MAHHRPVTAAAGRLLLASVLIVASPLASGGHTSETSAQRVTTGLLELHTARSTPRFPLHFANQSGTPVASQAVDFPLVPGTRWTFHLHHELGPGVHFGPEDAMLAKGNVLDTSVQSEVAGREAIDGRSYARIDSTRSGRAWSSEWSRIDDQGLFVAKRVEDGQPTVLDPPQKWLSAGLRDGEAWDWEARNAPVSMHTTVVGRESVRVPAGAFQAVKVSSDLTAQGQVPIQVHQDRWFVRGVGFVKQETTVTAASHMLTHVVLTLEHFEPSR